MDIEVQRLKTSSEWEEAGLSCYGLEFAKQAFGHLFFNPLEYSIVWKGSLNGDNIKDQMLGIFPGFLFDFFNIQGGQIHVLTNGDQDRYIKLPLPNTPSLEHVIGNDRVTFIRYDVEISTWNENIILTFTTESINSHQRDVELAVQLPRSQALTPAALGWIVSHHSKRNDISPYIDLKRSSDLLSRLDRPEPMSLGV